MTATAIDPVCGMEIDATSAVTVEHAGQIYHFCESACADTFRDDPDRWIVRGSTRESRPPFVKQPAG